MIRVVVAFGTRPEGIKMLPVVKALRRNKNIEVQVVVTGQHKEMLEPVFSIFGEAYDINLDVMTRNQNLTSLTSSIMNKMSCYLDSSKPDLILVHGDTTTALASSIAALYNKCRIGHVEAGLRSFDLGKPWPEEFNRVAIDAIADLMFAPTDVSAGNLSSEYHRRNGVYVTGNTGIDALMYVRGLLENGDVLRKDLDEKYSFLDAGRPLIVVTGHRRESFGLGFEQICYGLKAIAESGVAQIIYPVHLNPNVRSAVSEFLNDVRDVFLIEPVDYVEMIYLMLRAHILLTDSGGIQEEGPALGKPVLVMRDVTERPEAVATGVVKVIGTDPQRIFSEVFELLEPSVYADRARQVFPYGDGNAASKIASIIEERVCV